MRGHGASATKMARCGRGVALYGFTAYPSRIQKLRQGMEGHPVGAALLVPPWYSRSRSRSTWLEAQASRASLR